MSPVLFQFGETEVESYAVFMAVAFIAAWAMTVGLARRRGLPAEIVGSTTVIAVVVGVIAARGAWLAGHPEAWEGVLSLAALRAGEMLPYAGLTVGLLASAVHLGLRRVSPAAAWDVAAPAFCLGTMLERIGALLAGTSVGGYAPGVPWAIRYPADSTVFVEQRRTLGSLLPAGAEESLPVHPTQLYAVLLAGVGLWIALRMLKTPRRDGDVFLAMAAYALGVRVLVEQWWRTDAPAPVFGPFDPTQIVGAILVPALLLVRWARARKRGAVPPAPASPARPAKGVRVAEPARGTGKAERAAKGTRR
jgi:phosphatidylglycerol---prolipoprotein diacylglyceryl transferase